MRALVIALSVCALTACTEAKTLPACVELDIDPETCAPLFPPQFDRIYEEVLVGSGTEGCATASSACHSSSDAAGAGGGLIFTADPDAVYDALVPFLDDDPACGPFAARLNTQDPDFIMPPGDTRIDAGARCSIAQWMAAGAPR